MSSSILQTKNSASASISITPAASGNLLLCFMTTSGGGGSPWPSISSDSQGLSWSGVLGTIGTSGNSVAGGAGFFTSLFAPTLSSATENLTFSFNGGTPGSVQIWIAECTGVSTTSPVVCNMYNSQASPGTGTDALTTAGGTGSNNVSSVPALITGWFYSNTGGTISAGTGFTESYGGFNAASELEYKRVTSSGTYNATATISANNAVISWMIALVEPTGAPFAHYLASLGAGQ